MVKKLEDSAGLFVCGSRGSRSVSGEEYSDFGGLTTCFILKTGDYAIVIDVGTGLEKAASILAKCSKIDILLTHYHYDHILGLLNPFVFPENAKIRLYTYTEEKTGTEQLDELIGPPFWPKFDALGRFDFVQIQPGDEFDLEEGFHITTMPSNHAGETILYRISCEQYSVAIIGDYEHGKLDEAVAKFSEGVDILVYDGMFAPEEYSKFVGWGHSTWVEGIAIAKAAKAKELLITHHNPISDDATLYKAEAEAQAVFPNVRFAKMGDVIIL